MPIVTNNQFHLWLKSAVNMKLSYDASVLRITYEGLTNFRSFMDFYRDSIESLSKYWSNNIYAIVADVPNGIASKKAVPGTNISTISIRSLDISTNDVKYYNAIGQPPGLDNIHYVNALGEFNIDYNSYVLLNKQSSPGVLLVSDKYKENKIINWIPLFEDALSRTFGGKGPLFCIVRDNYDISNFGDDPLPENVHCSASGSMLEELINCLPHAGPIFHDENKTVFVIIAKAVSGTSVESTIKSYSRRKDGRAAFLAFIVNHAGDTKYRDIVKSRSKILQNIKWNG